MKQWKYRLIVKDGEYLSDSIFLLFLEINRRRFENFIFYGKWRD